VSRCSAIKVDGIGAGIRASKSIQTRRSVLHE